MKIIHLIGAINPGGAEILIKDISKIMSKNHSVEIWAMSKGENQVFENNFIEELKKSNVEIKVFNKQYKKGYFKFIKELRSEIKYKKPDIINSHFEEITVYSIISSMFLDIKIVETIHNTKINYPIIQKWFISKLIDKYIAISEKVEMILTEDLKIKDKKVETIFNGIFLKKFTNDRKINTSVEDIIAVGRLEEQKGHEVLIKAYSKVVNYLEKNNRTIPKLNIYGIGVLERKLLQLIDQEKINEYVKLKGVSNDIPLILKNGDIYVMPSLWEGLSISLIEAVASNIPIIATKVGSNDEVIQNNINGMLVESNNEEELANALIVLIENYDKRSKLSFNCKNNIEKFDINKTVKNYIKLYSNLK